MNTQHWDNIPLTLREQPTWVCWIWQERIDSNGDLRRTKVPINARTGRMASSTNPATWSSFETALEALDADPSLGLGFVFASGANLVGIDLDKVVDPETGDVTDLAAAIVTDLDSYTEVTPSGTGLHIIVQGTLPGPRRRTDGVEMYPDGRFFTMTGARLPKMPTTVNERSKELATLYNHLFPAPPPVTVVPVQRDVELTDKEILVKAIDARNGEKFRALMRGDIRGFESESNADAALLGILAFYTRDVAQLERLFNYSRLADEKWRSRPDYRARTIALALRQTGAHYSDWALCGPTTAMEE